MHQAFYDKFLAHEESADAAADYSNRFQNPFAHGNLKDKEKPGS
jgi:hypothetical protein